MKHEYESLIKCPYCDYEDSDSWEFGTDDGTTYCGSCSEEFNVSPSVDITYSTFRIDCEEKKLEHDYKFESTFIKKQDYNNKAWVDRDESNWEYIKIMQCSLCGDKEYPRITKEEFYQLEKPIN